MGPTEVRFLEKQPGQRAPVFTEKCGPHRGEVSGEAARAEGAGVHRAAGQQGAGSRGRPWRERDSLAASRRL